MKKVPSTYASQPEENQKRAVDETISFVFSRGGATTARESAAFLETLWNSCLHVGGVILSLQAPIPMRLPCPACGALHVDEGAFAFQAHHTHACQHCGMVWRPALVPTVGVQFLPGFKNEETST